MEKTENLEKAETTIENATLLNSIDTVRLELLARRDVKKEDTDTFFNDIADFNQRLEEKYTRAKLFLVPAWHKLVGSTVPEYHPVDDESIAIKTDIQNFIEQSVEKYNINVR